MEDLDNRWSAEGQVDPVHPMYQPFFPSDHNTFPFHHTKFPNLELSYHLEFYLPHIAPPFYYIFQSHMVTNDKSPQPNRHSRHLNLCQSSSHPLFLQVKQLRLTYFEK